MAYENFKATIWSKYIQHELAKTTVLQEDCNTRFQGEVGLGKTVKIVGVGRPTVGTYVPGTNIHEAQTPPDNSVLLHIDQYKYTHFLVDDIDQAQSIDGLMQAYMQESTAALAEARDSYIASLAAGAENKSESLAITTAEEARKAVDDALVFLWGNGVKINDEVVITVTPKFYSLLKQSLTAELSNNVDLIKKGILGYYSGAAVKMSNNLYNDGVDDYLLVRTKNAIAFASGIEKTEAYTPEYQFADAIKMLDCYGAKIIRQKELYVICAH
jgi:hypothetical protein